jgi:hypothetical protein
MITYRNQIAGRQARLSSQVALGWLSGDWFAILPAPG